MVECCFQLHLIAANQPAADVMWENNFPDSLNFISFFLAQKYMQYQSVVFRYP